MSISKYKKRKVPGKFVLSSIKLLFALTCCWNWTSNHFTFFNKCLFKYFQVLNNLVFYIFGEWLYFNFDFSMLFQCFSDYHDIWHFSEKILFFFKKLLGLTVWEPEEAPSCFWQYPAYNINRYTWYVHTKRRVSKCSWQEFFKMGTARQSVFHRK